VAVDTGRIICGSGIRYFRLTAVLQSIKLVSDDCRNTKDNESAGLVKWNLTAPAPKRLRISSMHSPLLPRSHTCVTQSPAPSVPGLAVVLGGELRCVNPDRNDWH